MIKRNAFTFLCVLFLLSGFICCSCKNGISNVNSGEKDNIYVCQFQGLQRKFSVYLPEEKPQGIILMLHGYGESISSFKSKTFMEKFALPLSYAVCFVSSGNEPGWNYGIPSSKKNDEKFILSLSEYLKKTYGTPETKTFLCGFSNGAFMTGTMAVKHPESFNGYICISGLPVLAQWNKLKPGANLMLVYGSKDDLIPFRAANKNVQYNFPFIEDVISHFEKTGALFETIEIPDGRHQWPEARTTGYEIDERILSFCRNCP